MDVERHNAEWLQAWSDKDVPRLIAFYSQDATPHSHLPNQDLNGNVIVGNDFGTNNLKARSRSTAWAPTPT